MEFLISVIDLFKGSFIGGVFIGFSFAITIMLTALFYFYKKVAKDLKTLYEYKIETLEKNYKQQKKILKKDTEILKNVYKEKEAIMEEKNQNIKLFYSQQEELLKMQRENLEKAYKEKMDALEKKAQATTQTLESYKNFYEQREKQRAIDNAANAASLFKI